MAFAVQYFDEAGWKALVNLWSGRFRNLTGFNVTQDALEAIIQPGIPYLDHINRELSEGAIDLAFLEGSVMKVLGRAMEIAQRSGLVEIQRNSVLQSIAEDCPYLFLC